MTYCCRAKMYNVNKIKNTILNKIKSKSYSLQLCGIPCWRLSLLIFSVILSLFFSENILEETDSVQGERIEAGKLSTLRQNSFQVSLDSAGKTNVPCKSAFFFFILSVGTHGALRCISGDHGPGEKQSCPITASGTD